LSQAGLSVVVLEQGPRHLPAHFRHDELKDWYLGGITNDAVRNPQTFRNDPTKKATLQKFKPPLWYGRAVGGGSLHYGDVGPRSADDDHSGTGVPRR